MISQVLSRIGYLLSVSLFAIMTFLNTFQEGEQLFLYDSPGQYKNYFEELEPSARQDILDLNCYDNVFVLFFGLYLLSYAFNLKKSLGWLYWIITAAGIGYMYCDWIENSMLLNIINNKPPGEDGFHYVQILKWVFIGVALIPTIAVDITLQKRLKHVIIYTGLALLVVVITHFSKQRVRTVIVSEANTLSSSPYHNSL